MASVRMLQHPPAPRLAAQLPEKAIIDLLYLNPYYKTEQDMIELRFDDFFMQDDLNVDLLLEYTAKVGSPSLTKRINLLLKTYGL